MAHPPTPRSGSRLGVPVLPALALTPLLFFPAGYEQFVLPKIVWTQITAILIVLVGGLSLLSGRHIGIRLHALNGLLAFFFVWHLLMWPLAASRSLASDRIAWVLAAIVVCWGWQEWAGERRRRVLMALWCLVFSASLTAAWALYQDIWAKWGDILPAWLPHQMPAVNRLGDWRGLVVAGMGNTDFIAAFLAMLHLPILLLMLQMRGRLRVVFLMLALWLLAAALIVCWSVGGNAALILGSLVVLIGVGRRRRSALWQRRRRRILVWIAGCAVAIVWLVTDTPLNPHRPGIFREAFSSERWHEGGPTRGVIWLNTLEMIRRNQLTGVGPGCFTYEYPKMLSSFVPNEDEWLMYQGSYTNAAHNSLLQAWAEMGPVGALLLIAMVVAAFRALGRVVRTSDRPLDAWIAWGGIGALSVLCFDSMMTFPLQLPTLLILFLACLPLGYMLSDPTADASGFQMPPLVLQGRWSEFVVRMQGMKRPVEARLALSLPRVVRATLMGLCLFLSGFLVWRAALPLMADATYRQAHETRRLIERVYANGSTPEKALLLNQADGLYRHALFLNPEHHDCRSSYSQFLLDNGRYQECVDQIGRVLERLDSRELYLRRRDAYQGLGLTTMARRDENVFRSRVSPARRPQSPSDQTSAPTRKATP